MLSRPPPSSASCNSALHASRAEVMVVAAYGKGQRDRARRFAYRMAAWVNLRDSDTVLRMERERGLA